MKEYKRLDVKKKFILATIISIVWLVFSVLISLPWLNDLSEKIGMIPAFLIILGLAYIPGLANSFLIASLFFDDRPDFPELTQYPPLTVLIAAYNEEKNIGETIDSIVKQKYPGEVTILVGDDGSTDNTRKITIEKSKEHSKSLIIRVHSVKNNIGKGMILNEILAMTETKYCITIDGDTYLFRNALRNIVKNIVNGPDKTAAIAGCVLVRNSRTNFLTKIQEWDYFHGIAVVKRIQSLYQGTLVAQGAFSIYETQVLKDLGGWDDTVGEDIVLTWAIRRHGYRVGYAEDAICFTNVPEKYKHFFNQRKRWSRGLIEAFKQHPEVIVQISPSTPFIWLNLTFPFNDFIFMFVFIPGVIAAVFFQYYAIAGIMTIVLVPMALLMNWAIYNKHTKTFKKLELRVRRNFIGFIMYILMYQIIMVPASLAGYTAELLKFKKTWGPK